MTTILFSLSPNHLIHSRAIATRREDIVNMKETNVIVGEEGQINI